MTFEWLGVFKRTKTALRRQLGRNYLFQQGQNYHAFKLSIFFHDCNMDGWVVSGHDYYVYAIYHHLCSTNINLALQLHI